MVTGAIFDVQSAVPDNGGMARGERKSARFDLRVTPKTKQYAVEISDVLGWSLADVVEEAIERFHKSDKVREAKRKKQAGE